MKDNEKLKGSTAIAPAIAQNITKEKLKGLLPKGSSAQVTDEILSTINTMGEDTDLPQELLEEEVMSYMHLVGSMSGVGIKDVISATKYCNLKRNYTNKEAWSIVFPDRYDRLITANKQVDNHVSMYNSSKLVVAIDKENLIAAHIKHYPYFDAAVKELAKVGLYNNAGNNADGEKMTVSPMVKVQALKELAALTKQPETAQLDIKIGQSDESLDMQAQMNQQLEALVAMQQKKLDNGSDIYDVQTIGISFDEVKSNG